MHTKMNDPQPPTEEAQPRKRRKIQTKRLVRGPLVNVIPRIEPPQSLSELAEHLPDAADAIQAELSRLNLDERPQNRSDTCRQALENEIKSHRNDIAAIEEDIVRLQENQEEDGFLQRLQDAVSTPLPSPPRPALSPPPTPRSPRYGHSLTEGTSGPTSVGF